MNHRMGGFALLVALGFCASACPDDVELTGQAVVLPDVQAKQAELDWSYGADSFSWRLGEANDVVDCEVYLLGAQVCEVVDAEVTPDAYFFFECDVLDTSVPFDHFSVQVGTFDDFRTLSEASDDSFGGLFSLHRRTCGAGCAVDNCYSELDDDVSVHVAVSGEAGSTAPFPDLVTSDFARTLTLSISADVTGSGDEENVDHCAEDVSVSGTLTVSLDAASLESTPQECDDS